MGERMTRNLVMESLLRAVEATQQPAGLLHHSDKGSQYCSLEYRRLLERLGMKASMSGTGNCYENAPMESFWAILKTELIFHRRFATVSRPFGRLPSTLKCSTIDSGYRSNWTIFHRLLSNVDTTSKGWQHDRFGVHYRRAVAQISLEKCSLICE